MHQAHGFGFDEYCQSFEKRIEVEKTREQSYKKSRWVVKDAVKDH
ncbi:hypothetical protein [Pueribacillus theae]|nr:hypothetical protein [Pueribacillus theae]